MKLNTFTLSCKSHQLDRLRGAEDLSVEDVQEFLAEGWYSITIMSALSKLEVKDKYGIV